MKKAVGPRGHAFNSSSWEAEGRGQRQTEFCVFKASLVYLVRSCLKKYQKETEGEEEEEEEAAVAAAKTKETKVKVT